MSRSKITSAHSEDSDQPAQFAQSDQSLHCPHEEVLGLLLPNNAKQRL